jgi:expansin (peptidoglycan-binding protein)
MDINKAGESYDVGLLDFSITMNSTIGKMADRLQIVEKMLTATTNRINYFKSKKGSSSALTSLQLKAHFKRLTLFN